MSELFPIIDDIAESQQFEQMGSKDKFWFYKAGTQDMWLFKLCRPDTGEDWSEKIAAEVANILSLPHAEVELAEYQNDRGVILKDFTNRTEKGALVHGNELLTRKDPKYPKEKRYNLSEYTIQNIHNVLSQDYIHLPKDLSFPKEVVTTPGLFLGYLMLDCLIGNTDRHHENWGILVQLDKSTDKRQACLAPSFDHASSLGREFREEKRQALAGGTDSNQRIEAYARRARSAVYLSKDDKRTLSTFQAFVEFGKLTGNARNVWLDRLSGIDEDSIKGIVERVPKTLLTPESADFVCRLVDVNKRMLQDL
jgi:hypothetical protein